MKYTKIDSIKQLKLKGDTLVMMKRVKFSYEDHNKGEVLKNVCNDEEMEEIILNDTEDYRP